MSSVRRRTFLDCLLHLQSFSRGLLSNLMITGYKVQRRNQLERSCIDLLNTFHKIVWIRQLDEFVILLFT